MDEELTSGSTAHLAVSKGFEQWALLKPPSQSLLNKWLRDIHHLHVNVQHNMHYCWQVQVQDIKGYDGTERTIDDKWLMYDYGTYEEALEAGLQHALQQLSSNE